LGGSSSSDSKKVERLVGRASGALELDERELDELEL
jgi:hypothetical protein